MFRLVVSTSTVSSISTSIFIHSCHKPRISITVILYVSIRCPFCLISSLKKTFRVTFPSQISVKKVDINVYDHAQPIRHRSGGRVPVGILIRRGNSTRTTTSVPPDSWRVLPHASFACGLDTCVRHRYAKPNQNPAHTAWWRRKTLFTTCSAVQRHTSSAPVWPGLKGLRAVLLDVPYARAGSSSLKPHR